MANTNQRCIIIKTRWPAEQRDSHTIEIIVPCGNGPFILNPEFVKTHKLTDVDIDNAEHAVLQEIAIVR